MYVCSDGWDTKAYLAAKAKKDEEILSILDFCIACAGREPDAAVVEALAQSCMVPFCASLLCNDSTTDIEARRHLYERVIGVCVAMARRPVRARSRQPARFELRALQSTAHLLCPLEDVPRCLGDLYEDLAARCAEVDRCAEAARRSVPSRRAQVDTRPGQAPACRGG
jgi:hypothetical protein